jgi:hypothetical protein
MLGNLDAPPGTDKQTAVAIRSRIAEAFVFCFRLSWNGAGALRLTGVDAEAARGIGSPSFVLLTRIRLKLCQVEFVGRQHMLGFCRRRVGRLGFPDVAWHHRKVRLPIDL